MPVTASKFHGDGNREFGKGPGFVSRLAWCALWTIVGCGGGGSGGHADGSEGPPDGGKDVGGVSACETFAQTFVASADVDVLIVVDNSFTMDSEQVRFGSAVDTLVRALVDPERGFPSAHIGVVSTNMGTGPYITGVSCAMIGGDAGFLQALPRLPECTAPSGDFLEIANTDGVLSGNIANVDTPTSDGTTCQGNLSGSTPVPAAGDELLDVCDVQAALRCIAPIGTSGCSFEQPLEAARRALACDEGNCTNPGFLRDDAWLAVIFLSDADDCSATDGAVFDPSQTALDSELGPLTKYRCFEFGATCDQVIDRTGTQTLTGCRSKTVDDVGGDPADLYLVPIEEYSDFFSLLRPAGGVVLSAITGPFGPGDSVTTGANMSMIPFVEPICTGPAGGDSAVPPIRTHELVRSFGSSGVVLSDLNAQAGICTDDFGPALSAIGDAVRGRHPAGHCIDARLFRMTDEGPAPITDGTQASCSVTEVTNPGAENETRLEIERCEFDGGAPAPCPSASTSPGTLTGASAGPCWYVCDSGSPAEGGCEHGWQLRV